MSDDAAAEAHTTDDATQPTVTVEYPSPDFPPTPAFRLRVPDGWRAVPTSRSLMVVQAPDASVGYRPNVTVNARRVPPSERADDDLAAAIEHDLAKPDYDVVESVSFPNGATPAHAVVVRFTTGDRTAVEAHQLHVYIPGSDRSAHVVTITGTVAARAATAEREAVHAIVRSFRPT